MLQIVWKKEEGRSRLLLIIWEAGTTVFGIDLRAKEITNLEDIWQGMPLTTSLHKQELLLTVHGATYTISSGKISDSILK